VGIDRGLLLPRSGVGVEPPWLIIAPLGSAAIRIDLRILDRISVPTGEPMIVLECNELEVGLDIAEGHEAALTISRAAWKWTRAHTGARPALSPPRQHAKLVWINELACQSGRVPPPQFAIDKPEMTIGRCDADIVLRHRSVSRKHARITRDDTGLYTIHDETSTNGVRVNGEDYTEAELCDGDIVDLGHARMAFVEPGDVFERDAPCRLEHCVIVGSDVVLMMEDRLHIGGVDYPLEDIARHSEGGTNLLAPAGPIQGGVAALVVAATLRDAITGASGSGRRASAGRSHSSNA
jgi:hypothetical protein